MRAAENHVGSTFLNLPLTAEFMLGTFEEKKERT
jgi:hypothetical protein